MEIDKIEQMVYALDLVIDRYIDRVMDRRSLDSLRNEIYDFYHGMMYPYCGYSMSKTIIRNELIVNLGEKQAAHVYEHLF